MNGNFPRIITLLRKERGLSQKRAAEALGISQALLSHYEKGIRECGLDFVVRAADFYGVSCDYLLGRSPDRTGATLTLEDIPEPDAMGRENMSRGSLIPVLNKKLIANSLNIIFGILQQCNHKELTNEISACLSAAAYRCFRLLYSANPKNPQGLFSVPEKVSSAYSLASENIAEAKARALAEGEKLDGIEGLSQEKAPSLSPEILSSQYPLFSSSLFNLIKNAETRMKQ